MKKMANSGTSRWIWRVAFFGLALFVSIAQVTDADLLDREIIAANTISSTSLDIGVRHSFGATEMTTLFSTFGLVEGGFDVRGVRIVRLGDLGFEYRVRTEQSSGDTVLCQALDLVYIKQWQLVTQADLLSFVHQDSLGDSDRQDRIILAVVLDEDAAELMNKTCSFSIVVESIPSSDPAGTKFFDSEVIANTISTGTWEIE